MVPRFPGWEGELSLSTSVRLPLSVHGCAQITFALLPPSSSPPLHCESFRGTVVPRGPLPNSLPSSGGKDQGQLFCITPAHSVGVPGTLDQIGTPDLAPRNLQHSLPLALSC